MKISIKIVVLLITLSNLFLGCKRYPEDPSLSLKRPIKRLIDATNWNMYSYYINGIDSTTNLIHRETPLFLVNATVINFYVVGTHTTNNSVDFNGNIGNGTFTLVDNKNKLNIYISSLRSGCYNPFINNGSDWDIEELTLTMLKIKSTINGINYEITFAGG